MTISDGEPSRLLDAWAGAPLAVVVDAVLCDDPAPGRIHRTALDAAPPGPPRAGKAPRPARTGWASRTRSGSPRHWTARHQRLIVFAVEAADIGFGPGLSAAVGACLPELTQAVLAELEADPPR